LILPLQSDYRVSDSAALNTGTGGSNLVKSVGAVTNGTCTGIKTPGGEGTFYAGAITQAQNYLNYYHTAGVQDIMIILSDGDATACGLIPTTYSVQSLRGTLPSGAPFNCTKNQMTGTATSYTITNECGQAVTAASNAKSYVQSDGTSTIIYSISYGSETTGCYYDMSTLPNGSAYNPGFGTDNYTPCSTMANLATIPAGVTPGDTVNPYFFSVPNAAQSGGTVCTGAVPITQLDQVFTTIAGELSKARLVTNVVY